MLGLFNRKRRFKEGPLLTEGVANSFVGVSAAFSGDANTVIIGASRADIGSNFNQGSATIFTRSGGAWTQQQTITQTGGTADDDFGLSVALSADGNTAIVGAPKNGVGGSIWQGSATIFTRSGSTWTQQQTITQTGGAASDQFGYSVALSSDGNTAIVGALFDDVGSNSDQGSATIFTRSGGVWTQQQTITQTGGAASDYFGGSVALSSDGNTAIVGAYSDDVGLNNAQGSATIFTRSAGVWTQQQTITRTGAGVGDEFGTSVALSADGNIAIVGAPRFDGPLAGNQGSATFFTRSGSVWTELQTINKSDGAANDYFGYKVSLSSNGNIAIIGSYSDDVGVNAEQGSATIFTRTSGVWTQQQTITQTGGAANDYFGYSVTLSADGNTAVVGAVGDDVGASGDQGSATIFYRR